MSLRVLHGPVNVGNQPYVLSRFERELGARSELVVNYSTWLDYPADKVLGEYGATGWRARARRLGFGLTAPLRFDVLHFYFGRSFLTPDDQRGPATSWFQDMKLARRLRRTVVMTFQGCDVRISHASAAAFDVTPCRLGQCNAASTCREVLDDRRLATIDAVLPYLDHAFVLNPELARYVPGAQFVPYANVDVRAHEPSFPLDEPDRPIRVVHAPSDESIKGSKLVYEAVQSLQERFAIDFRLVRGLPHAEAVRLYADADLVIDQVLAGWYGGLAVEVMAMGKPVAAYIRDEDLEVLPAGMRDELPILRVHPTTLERDLEQLLLDRGRLGVMGRRSREFVLRWHDPRVIARQMLDAYTGSGG